MIQFFRRLAPFIRPQRKHLIMGLACGILLAITNVLLMLMVKFVVNLVFGVNSSEGLVGQLQHVPSLFKDLAQSLTGWLPQLSKQPDKVTVMLAIATIPCIMILRAIFDFLNIYLVQSASTRTIANLRTRLFEHFQNLPLSFFNTAKTGELISRITSDTQALHMTISLSAPAIVRDPITVIALLVLLLSKQPKLTMISIVVFPVCVVPILVYGHKMRRAARTTQTYLAELAAIMHESLTGNRIIKAYNLERTVVAQFKTMADKVASNIMRIVRANEIPGQLMEIFGAIGVALVCFYVVLQNDRSMTPGDFLQFVGSVFLLYRPVKQLSRLHTQLQQARAASERVFQLLETQSTVADPPNPIPFNAHNADIEFKNISFDYGEKPVLRDINLTVKAGQLVALVGASGSGKTTLTNLLLRFYDPQKGAVLIGGMDLRKVSMRDLRNQIAIVTQETILFNDTARNNILLGRPDASITEVETAAKNAFAHDFILEKPQGYDTLIGEKGAALSGGQRQRLAIARAILKDAPILVLDEATSALDSESERTVQAALDKLMQGRTTLCIAHRLSTIQKADLIVVLSAGRIVETGHHEELLAHRGVYRKLYELQFQI